MGNLPIHRVNVERAFSKIGIDFAGPINTKRMGGRVKVFLKTYIALFVCLSTKAVHIELVSDLTSNALLSALKRFVGRRGLPTDIYTDNATNFKGAFYHLQRTLVQSDLIQRFSQEHQINWHFIPPSSPHFGGIWESAIKSMKTHLTRVIGDQVLNFEELSTLLIQIEACLNSRPLSPMSSDPRDLNVITPGHFLIFAPLTAIPERDVTGDKMNHVKRWTLVQQLHQHFWKRWSQEYLHNLQQRTKWMEVKKNLKIGDLIIIKEDNLPPCKWQMARVEQVHPGSDGIVRVVTLKTLNGILKRPLSKIIVLPTDN